MAGITEEEIVKEVEVLLTNEEIESPLDIVIKLTIKDEEGDEITYTIKYPKQS